MKNDTFIEYLDLKVKVSDITDEDIAKLKESTKRKIKDYVEKQNTKNSSFKYASVKVLVDRKLTTKKFLENNHVCMKCGDVQEMATYAIAQTAMGHRVNYTCPCGHITTLPQLIKQAR